MSYTKKQIDSYDYDEDYFQPIVELYLLSLNHYKKYFNSLDFNISPPQWHALNRLWKEDGLTQAELAKKIFRDYTFITRLLDDLEKKGFVQRNIDPADRRVNRIFLTKKSKDFKYKAYPYFLDRAEKLRNGLTDEDLETLRKLCKRLINNYSHFK
ncbi:MAG: MarR family transcriptional regulator [Ignavibacteria bacterium]|jgi:DNA-binding MarR family transcriptional regulator